MCTRSLPAIVILLLALSTFVTVTGFPDSVNAASEQPISITAITGVPPPTDIDSYQITTSPAILGAHAAFAITSRMTNGTQTVKMIQVGNSPDAVALNPVTGMVYVTDFSDNNVTVINGASNSPVANITVGDGPDAIAVNPSSDTIYVANSWDDNVTVINGRTLTNVTTIAVGSMPDAIAIDPSTGNVYVVNSYDSTVSVINNATNKVIGTFPVGDFPDAIAINPSSGRIYVADGDDNNVTVVNRSGFREIANVTVGDGPDAVAVNPLSGNVYVADYLDNNVTVISGARNKGVANVTVGNGPDAIALDLFDGSYYVANFFDNTMTLLNSSNDVLNVTAVGQAPTAVAVNPTTGIAYVTNYDDNTVSVIAGPVPRVSQPIQLTVAESGPSATVKLSGCSVSPTSIAANGVAQTVQAAPGCTITGILPSTNNTRYEGSGGVSSLSIETCSSPGTCPTHSATIYCQFSYTLSYSVAGGGIPAAPTLTSTQFGTAYTPTLTTLATSYWLDNSASWSVTNPLGESSGSERWMTSATTSGLVSGPAVESPVYEHQYHVFVEDAPPEGGSVSPTSEWFDSAAQLDLSAKASTGWQFEGWTGTGSGSYSGTSLSSVVTVGGPENETALFYPGLTIAVSGSGSAHYSFGTTQGTVQSGRNQTVYAPKGSTIVLTANPSSLLYSFAGWSRVPSGNTSQGKILLTGPSVVEASFSYNFVTIGGMAAVVAIIAAVSALFLRGRKQVLTQTERQAGPVGSGPIMGSNPLSGRKSLARLIRYIVSALPRMLLEAQPVGATVPPH